MAPRRWPGAALGAVGLILVAVYSIGFGFLGRPWWLVTAGVACLLLGAFLLWVSRPSKWSKVEIDMQLQALEGLLQQAEAMPKRSLERRDLVPKLNHVQALLLRERDRARDTPLKTVLQRRAQQVQAQTTDAS